MFARSIDLVGFVENLPDGRVKLTAQGTRKQLEQLLKDIQSAFDQEISHVDSDFQVIDTKYPSFSIR